MKIAIVGFNAEGRATYDFFANQNAGHDITVCDQNPDVEVSADTKAVLGEAYLDDLDHFDLIVRTAGMHPRKILDRNPAVADRITTHINEFFKASPTSNIIGVTGTKGKGTTSTLISRMLEAKGETVRLGGNIGLPPLSFIDELDADSWVVLELSSFQLIDMRHSPRIAVCLMVVPEHLDWHADLEEYISAKEQLFARQATGDVAIYYYENPVSKRIAGAGQAQKVPYYHYPGAEVVDDDGVSRIVIDDTEICRTDELKLLGRHNWQNVCAAVTAVWYAAMTADIQACGPDERPDVAAIREVLTSFTGLEHRLEFVRELNGVRYYDDSFGTTPETAIVAVQAFPDRQKVLILGGSDKGAEYSELAKAVSNVGVRSFLLIGNQADRIQAALESEGLRNFAPGGMNMHDIVAHSASVAQPGDIVLLSTACASFDMFRNYKDRGEQFKMAVKALPEPGQVV